MTQALYILHTAIAHTCPQAAHELEHDIRQASAERHSALYALGNKFLGVALEISVLAARSHSSERAHTSVYLKATTLEYLDVAGRLFGTCKETTDHNRARSAAYRLDNVAAELNSAVRNNSLAHLVRLLAAIHNRGDLRHAYTRNNSRSTDRAGSDTDLDYVCAVVYQRLGCFRSSHIADYERQRREFRLDRSYAVKHILAVPVSGIDSDYVYPRLHKSGYSVHDIRGDADRSARKQSASLILGGIGILDSLLYILDCYKTLKIIVLIYKGELLYTVLAQYLLSLRKSGADRSCHELVLSHDVAYPLLEIRLEAQISVGNYTHELAVDCDRHAAYLKLVHQVERIRQLMVGRKIERIGNDAVLASLYLIDVERLSLDAHILMNHADSALSSHRYGELVLRDRIHRCA